MGKKQAKAFHKRIDIHMANKHVKRCSSFLIREMQTASMRYHSLHVSQNDKIKNRNNIKYWGRGEQL